MRLIGKIIGIFVLVVVLLAVIGVSMYASDYPVQGTVTETRCSSTPPIIVVDVAVVGDQDVEVTRDQCGILKVDNHVVYHIRSGRTIIYERDGGRCLYDSETGYGCGKPLAPLLG